MDSTTIDKMAVDAIDDSKAAHCSHHSSWEGNNTSSEKKTDSNSATGNEAVAKDAAEKSTPCNCLSANCALENNSAGHKSPEGNVHVHHVENDHTTKQNKPDLQTVGEVHGLHSPDMFMDVDDVHDPNSADNFMDVDEEHELGSVDNFMDVDEEHDQDSPETFMDLDDVHELDNPDIFMDVDDVAGHFIAGDPELIPSNTSNLAVSNQHMSNEATVDVISHSIPGPQHEVAKEMHKFMQLPTELRLMVWEFAVEEAVEASGYYRNRHETTAGCVQRFRFNLVYDPERVKPGKDKSRGWVACFTPVKINARKDRVFLRASKETRDEMKHQEKMSMLTFHELPVGKDGRAMRPRKCHLPFDFARDDFCIEGITHGLKKAQKKRKNKDSVWDPETLPLADLLDNALGLRFAPRIKRLIIIPHYRDTAYRRDFLENRDDTRRNFIETTNGKNMIVLAKRFPSLVTVKSAIPRSLGSSRYFKWRTGSLRGRGLGGVTRMSEENRDVLYRKAWRRIFDVPFSLEIILHGFEMSLYDGWVCLV